MDFMVLEKLGLIREKPAKAGVLWRTDEIETHVLST